METFASNMKMEIMKKDPPFGEESLKAGMYDDGIAWSIWVAWFWQGTGVKLAWVVHQNEAMSVYHK